MPKRLPGWALVTLCITTLIGIHSGFLSSAWATAAQPDYLNPDLPIDQRVADLISRMTLEEKVQQLGHRTPPIHDDGRGLYLGGYDYRNEALHGVVMPGATVFPQALALSSTWDPDLVHAVATAISTEARVYNNQHGKGLTYWSPTINLARDPRWGRTEESYGEDPYLTGRLAVAFVTGMQGDDPRYLKTVATPKHLIANNAEFNRHNGSSSVDERNLMEYYWPPFRAAVVEGGAFSVMSAYNALNGVPCSANETLLTDMLRGEAGLEGYIVSDCWAIKDIHLSHHYVDTETEAAALAIQAGTDLNCGDYYQAYLLDAITQALITEENVDRALSRVLKARFLLGEFDPPGIVSYTSIPNSALDSPEHRELALRATHRSIVLLKNENNLLPLNRDTIKSIAVIGPNADKVILGGYSGTPTFSVSPLQGIEAKFDGTISYARGCDVIGDQTASFDEAVNIARGSDVAIVVVGTDLEIAREELDRFDITLPGVQENLVRAVYEANPNTVVVLVTAGPLAINWAQENVPAILAAWYGGQSQGTAIADVLFGDVAPGGKLTMTWFKSVNDLPDFADYDIHKGRTYMYFEGAVLYPFGHGLSYTHFEYSRLRVKPRRTGTDGQVTVSVDVKNVGQRVGDEVVQLYIRDAEASVKRPIKELRGFQRITLQPGEKRTVTFSLPVGELAFWDMIAGDYVVEEGEFTILVGSSSEDIRLAEKLVVGAAQLEALQAILIVASGLIVVVIAFIVAGRTVQ